MPEKLPIWVIYDSPIDLPDRFVARKWLLNMPTTKLLQSKTLDGLREKLPLGLVRMPRDVQDDPKIVESWI